MKQNLIRLVGLFIFGVFSIVYAKKSLTPSSDQTLTLNQAERIKIMTYNVENLFDTLDDPTKDDETFLPKKKKRSKKIQEKCKKAKKRHWVNDCLNTNWTTYKLDLKMSRLAKVIKAYNPDILILQEIENLNLLSEFNKKHLNYPSVTLLEGPDKRGIDVGILSKLQTEGSPKLHLQKMKPNAYFKKSRIKPTRGILEVTYRLSQKDNLSVFGLHFPSQGSPSEARKQAIKRLNEVAKASSSKYKIAAGDFNITSSEEHKLSLYKKDLGKYWSISHLIGCKKCKGTNYYHPKRSWSFFDAILFNGFTNKSEWKINKKSIQVFNELSLQNTKHKTPSRFNMGLSKYGVSDHWPVVAEIYKN